MTERWEDLSMTTMKKKGTKRPWSYFLIRSVSEAVSSTVAHNLFQPRLQVRAQDILRLDCRREYRLDSSGRAAVVGVSLPLSLPFAHRHPQHRMREPQQLSHGCSVRSPVPCLTSLIPCRHRVLVTTIPSTVRNSPVIPDRWLSTLTTTLLKKRSLLRLTAKATQFGKRTFTSWLIESVGTVPLKRRSDYPEDAQVDNTEVMSHLMDV